MALKGHVFCNITKFGVENASFFIIIFLEVLITFLMDLEFFVKQHFRLFNVFNFHDILFYILLLNSPSLECFPQYDLPLPIFLNTDEF